MRFAGPDSQSNNRRLKPPLLTLMKQTILQILHVLGWVAFVPFVTGSAVALVVGFVLFVTDDRTAMEHAFAGCISMFALSLPGLVTVTATRAALRRLKERELKSPGFEPIMRREK